MSPLLLALIAATNALILAQLIRMHAFTRRRYAETVESLDAAEQELRFLRLMADRPHGTRGESRG
jgi:hypothetical protein